MNVIQINWSEKRPASNEVTYNHIMGVTPIGNFRIKWRCGENIPSYNLYHAVNGGYVNSFSSLEGAKDEAQLQFSAAIKNCLEDPVSTEDSTRFLATRLRRVSKLVGIKNDMSDADLVGVAGTVLGQVARNIEHKLTKAKSEISGVVPLKIYCRKEDMSPDGRLQLHRQEDGDVCLTVMEGYLEGGISESASVEFCTPFLGGGGSHETYGALLRLMEAMEKDNRNPQLQNRKFEV